MESGCRIGSFSKVNLSVSAKDGAIETWKHAASGDVRNKHRWRHQSAITTHRHFNRPLTDIYVIDQKYDTWTLLGISYILHYSSVIYFIFRFYQRNLYWKCTWSEWTLLSKHRPTFYTIVCFFLIKIHSDVNLRHFLHSIRENVCKNIIIQMAQRPSGKYLRP